MTGGNRQNRHGSYRVTNSGTDKAKSSGMINMINMIILKLTTHQNLQRVRHQVPYMETGMNQDRTDELLRRDQNRVWQRAQELDKDMRGILDMRGVLHGTMTGNMIRIIIEGTIIEIMFEGIIEAILLVIGGGKIKTEIERTMNGSGILNATVGLESAVGGDDLNDWKNTWLM